MKKFILKLLKADIPLWFILVTQIIAYFIKQFFQL